MAEWRYCLPTQLFDNFHSLPNNTVMGSPDMRAWNKITMKISINPPDYRSNSISTATSSATDSVDPPEEAGKPVANSSAPIKVMPSDIKYPNQQQSSKPKNIDTAESGEPRGPDPTRYGDWEKNGRCIDF